MLETNFEIATNNERIDITQKIYESSVKKSHEKLMF